MSITSYPFDSQDTNEDQYTKLFREFQDSGVVASVIDGDLKVTANGSGLRVSMSPGLAIVRGHMMWNDGIEDLPVQPGSTVPRTDIVVLHLDPVLNTIVPQVIAGDPVTGQAPALLRTDLGVYEILLATINVPAGAVTLTSDKVNDRREFVGSRVRSWHTATRPTAGMRDGQLGFNVDIGRFEHWRQAYGWMELGVGWGALLDKPDVFPPVTHSHPWQGLSTRITRGFSQVTTGKVNTGNVITALNIATYAANNTVVARFRGFAGFHTASVEVGVDITAPSGNLAASTNGYRATAGAADWTSLACETVFWGVQPGILPITFKTSSVGGPAYFRGVIDIEVIPE